MPARCPQIVAAAARINPGSGRLSAAHLSATYLSAAHLSTRVLGSTWIGDQVNDRGDDGVTHLTIVNSRPASSA